MPGEPQVTVGQNAIQQAKQFGDAVPLTGIILTKLDGTAKGGCIIGISELMFEKYWGQPLLGGATNEWFPFVLAAIFLLFRPQGLFGERIIERV